MVQCCCCGAPIRVYIQAADNLSYGEEVEDDPFDDEDSNDENYYTNEYPDEEDNCLHDDSSTGDADSDNGQDEPPDSVYFYDSARNYQLPSHGYYDGDPIDRNRFRIGDEDEDEDDAEW